MRLVCLLQSLCVSLGAPGWRKPSTLYPWRRVPAPSRVRRAWVIPPISVSENHKRLPYPLVQIKSDKQQLGSVIYSIQGPGVDEEPRGVFSIDKFTGKVFLNAMLDREKTDRFRLRAFALDLGGSTLEDPTDLEIVVVDQNDNRPAFLQEAFTGRVLEGAAPGEAGAQPQPGRAAGKSSRVTGCASFPQALDYESCERYELKVSVENEAPLQAAAPRAEWGQARVRVHVQDTNEAPVFQENPLRTSLAEGAPPGTLVATFSARDPDTEQLQRLSYSKDYDPEDWLQVDPATGRIQTQRVLSPASPFLKGGWYRAIVLAQDDASPPRTATGTLSVEILEVNDHAPVLALPLLGRLCSEPHQGPGLLLGATDEDLPPHGAPFHFQLSPRLPELSRNWSLSQVNVSHARLRPRHQVPEGLHRLSLLLRDSGQPPQQREQPLNVTVCRCSQDGVCLPGAAALQAGGAGVSLGALVIVLASVLLLLLLVLLVALRARFQQQSRGKGLLGSPQDDLRDNVLNYDEQGGGEEDQDAYDISQLRHPTALSLPLGPPPLRRDAPQGRLHPQPLRALPTSPLDIADFISDGLEAADSDPSVPPYDTALIYDYEGEGSVAGTLSSILSSQGDEDQDYDYLRDWGPRFARLADMYGYPWDHQARDSLSPGAPPPRHRGWTA
uniref:Cadherin 15 n=1 Tax=Aotus nancymaae TaxID=37293 RepID=A0A2K5ETV3_AOTNA